MNGWPKEAYIESDAFRQIKTKAQERRGKYQ